MRPTRLRSWKNDDLGFVAQRETMDDGCQPSSIERMSISRFLMGVMSWVMEVKVIDEEKVCLDAS